MAAEGAESARAQLTEDQEKKDDEVLEREGVEQDLMQKDASPVGEQLEDVQSDAKRG